MTGPGRPFPVRNMVRRETLTLSRPETTVSASPPNLWTMKAIRLFALVALLSFLPAVLVRAADVAFQK